MSETTELVPLPDLIVATAAMSPDAIAITQSAREVDYRSLVSAAAGLAGRLRGIGAGPEVRIGVCARRTPDLPVALLGILMTGAACVPLDTRDPWQRVVSILDDAEISTLVVDPPGTELLASTGRRLVAIQGDERGGFAPDLIAMHPCAAAFLRYVSGPDGRPAGIVLSHGGLAECAAAAGQSRFAGTPIASTGLLDMLIPLAWGGLVRLVPSESQLDADQPHAWDETTGLVAGRHIQVLDERLAACPAGVEGEVFAGGPQIARGYHRRPALTAERFVPGSGGQRRFRTGDLGVVGGDGTVALLGRLDRQVKISGRRAEPSEVEVVLGSHPQITRVMVEPVPGDAGPELVAYVTPADAASPDEVRAYCAARLPAYLVPARVVSGVPRSQASEPDPGADRPADPEQARLERAVAAQWARVMRGPAPARTDDFIASGGNSLLAMRLVAGLRRETGRAIALDDVLAGRTVAGIAARAAAARTGDEPVPGHCPPALSALQRRIWFVEQLTPGIAAHNIAIAERLRGKLDVAALRAALGDVAARHDVLRWRVGAVGGVPVVQMDPPGSTPMALPIDDLAGMSPAAQRGEQLARLRAEARTPFDLEGGPLWRARLIRLSPDEHVLALTLHHIVFDGWSQDVLFRSLSDAYRRRLAVDPTGDGPLDVTFADYVGWLSRREPERLGKDLTWWADHLAGAPPALELPGDRARPPVQTFRGASAQAELGTQVSGRVRDLAIGAGCTPYAVLLAAFGQLLRRLTGRHDLIVGTPLADRWQVAFEPVIGPCLQMLPLRLRMSDEASFADHVHRCRQEVATAIGHADAPLDRIVESRGGVRDLSRNPLIQVLFNMYSFAEPHLTLPGITSSPLPPGLPGSLFDLTLYVTERRDLTSLQVVYNPDLFDADRIEQFLAGYLRLLDQFTAEPHRPVSAASMRPADSGLPDRTAKLPAWTGPGIAERVRLVALARPRRIALDGPGGRLSYGDLLTLAERTSTALRAAGARPGDAVAVIAARDTRLPPVLLGILSAGARWAIVDPALPVPVLSRQLAAISPQVLIDFSGVAIPGLAAVPAIGIADLTVLARGGDPPEPPGAGAPHGTAFPPRKLRSSVQAAPRPGAPAWEGDASEPPERGYLAITSGTTGDPKLVDTPEAPLAHFLCWYPAAFGLGPGDRFAMLGGLSHDPLLRDVFTPLVLGARLYVPTQALLRDPARLAGWLTARRVTVAHLTPQLARLLVMSGSSLPELRLIALGGDRMTGIDVAGLRRCAPATRIVNCYGTTETPQIQACYEVPPDNPHGSGQAAADRTAASPVPVGRGIPGAQLLVLDAGRRQAGVGELGEIVIRSQHLATGYLDAELTARRFAADPAGGRLFFTGDLGRYRADGAVVLAGRRDDQVKIRGFRVELGSVEAALDADPDVRQACVVAADEGAERVLRAYAVPSRAGVDTEQVLGRLRARLPDYAVPATLTPLSALPLTGNGKVDRAALPSPATRPRRARDRQLTGPTERAVAGVWREVLGRPRLGAIDNFFEIGGHSLTMVAVQVRLAELGWQISVLDLFRYPTIRALAAHIDGSAGNQALRNAAHRVTQRRARVRLPADSRPGLGGSHEQHQRA